MIQPEEYRGMYSLRSKYLLSACSVAGLLLLLMSCSSHKIEQVERAVYFWKSNSYFSDAEKKTCDSLGIQKLYVKFFEVNFSAERGSFPESKTEWWGRYSELKKNTDIIPTVYLRNSVFLKSTRVELDMLADNVNFLLNRLLDERFPPGLSVKEFQMDCDWTIKSKENYFYFLEKLKTLSGKEISCTLRLYPYKYPGKMGVPPVDRVTLMCYNLLQPLENPAKNSILDLHELESYLKGAPDYPKHMDLVLPVFSWAQVYHNERFSEVMHNDIRSIKNNLKPIKPLWYAVLRDTMVNGTYLRSGDQLKYEEVDAAKVKQAIVLLKKYIRFEEHTTVALFHLDEQQLKNYTGEELSGFYTDLSK